MNREDVQRAYDAVLAANAAEPYVHDAYMRADRELMRVAVSYYGDLHADRAREIMLDCGEVWSVERVIKDKTDDLRGELNQQVEFLAWATDEDYVKTVSLKIQHLAYDLMAIDARYDVGAWIDEAMVAALREKAEQVGAITLRKRTASV